MKKKLSRDIDILRRHAEFDKHRVIRLVSNDAQEFSSDVKMRWVSGFGEPLI